ncbi:MAG: hypothetical protein ACE5F6_03495 [Anaerolineae bacterium]
MINFLGSILLLLLMVAITLFATVLVVAGFMGVGALFARYTELTLFQATLVTVPVGMAALYLFARIMNFPNSTAGDDEWEDWDEDLEFEDLSPGERRRVLQRLVDLLEEFDAEDVVIPPKQPRKRRR